MLAVVESEPGDRKSRRAPERDTGWEGANRFFSPYCGQEFEVRVNQAAVQVLGPVEKPLFH